jgi:hypothetical protein
MPVELNALWAGRSIMKRLLIRDIASQAFAAAGIGEKNTISNGPDDGTLNRLAAHFWQARRHGNTTQAIDNILTASILKIDPPPPNIYTEVGVLSTGGANIAGHANDGQMETGMGQTGPYDDSKILLPWNEWNWGPQFDRIKPTGVTYISLWGCHPGAGQQGADLLFAIAGHCGRAVRGGTGFLYVNDQSVWWENGSQWQVATPTTKPAPIQAPSPHFTVANVKLEIDGAEFEANDVTSIEVELSEAQARGTAVTVYSDQMARGIVAQLFQSHPIDFSKTTIPAMVTGHITINFSKGVSAKLIVYNDRLAVEQKTRTGYYITSIRSVVASGGGR